MNIISPITFIDRLIKENELGQPFALFPFQREILNLAFAFDEKGKLPYDTILYSCPKKSGKSTINAALTLWWALTQERPNTCLLLANDREQSLSLVFSSIEGLIQHNPETQAECEVQSKTIYCANGTVIKALSSEYSTASGSNHGWTSWDELWCYTSEGSRRLWEELTSVPTRRNSIRFITTYAGYTQESELLEDLYDQVVRDGERIHDELPIYANKPARLFAYWDNHARLPWQTPEYYETQRRTLRPATFSACIVTSGCRLSRVSSSQRCMTRASRRGFERI
jgi:phage terminase large subunit-like protein